MNQRLFLTVSSVCSFVCAIALFTPCTMATDYAELVGVEVVRGALLEGGIEEVNYDDDAYLHTRSGFGRTLIDLHSMEMQLRFHACATDPQQLNLILESYIEGEFGIAQVRLWNWSNQAFDLIDTYPIGPKEETHIVPGVVPLPYINPDGELLMSITHVVFVPFLAFQFQSFIDNVEIEVVSPELTLDFAFPMDGGEYLLVDRLDELCHKSVIIQTAPDFALPFQVLPVDQDGKVVEGAAMNVFPGTTVAYDIPWAIAYVARTNDFGDIAQGQLVSARRIIRTSWADRVCASEWMTIVTSGEEGRHKIKIWGESDPDGDGVFEASQCSLQVVETLLDAAGDPVLDKNGDPVHYESRRVDPGDDGSVRVYRLSEDYEKAGYQIRFQVKCNGNDDETCRISVRIFDVGS